LKLFLELKQQWFQINRLSSWPKVCCWPWKFHVNPSAIFGLITRINADTHIIHTAERYRLYKLLHVEANKHRPKLVLVNSQVLFVYVGQYIHAAQK